MTVHDWVQLRPQVVSVAVFSRTITFIILLNIFRIREILKTGGYYSDIPYRSSCWGIIHSHYGFTPIAGERKYLVDYNIITQVIIEIRALSLVENGVILRYIHLRLIFKMAASCFVDGSEKEINIIQENAIPRNTKHATKFGVTLSKAVKN